VFTRKMPAMQRSTAGNYKQIYYGRCGIVVIASASRTEDTAKIRGKASQSVWKHCT
jgi:hypothetical protein